MIAVAYTSDISMVALGIAAGCLAGIGFTMSLFIAGLALEGGLLTSAKVGILTGSGISALLGMVILLWFLGKSNDATASRRG